MTSGMLAEAGKELETEKDWEMFKNGVAANVKMLEGMHYVHPTNNDLLFALLKAYTGMGFGISETQGLKDKLLEKDDSPYFRQAIVEYSKAMDYGFRYLYDNGVKYEELIKSVREEGGVQAYLDNELGNSDEKVEAAFYLAQAWGALINLERSNMFMMSQLGVIKGMFDWACGKKPDLANGGCGLFYGAYEAGRPVMLGGNPEKGKEYFERAIKRYPSNMLIRVAYIEYYLIPQLEEDVYQVQKAFLSKKAREFVASQDMGQLMKQKGFVPGTGNKSRLNLYNAIAFKRFNTIRRLEKEIF